MYDEESVIQDDDILMAEFAEEARRLQYLEKQGICVHGSAVGLPDNGMIYYPEQVGLKRGQVRCTAGCGQVFDSEEDWDCARSSF